MNINGASILGIYLTVIIGVTSCSTNTSVMEVEAGKVAVAYHTDSCYWDSVNVYHTGTHTINHGFILHTFPSEEFELQGDTIVGISPDLKEIELVVGYKIKLKQEALYELAKSLHGNDYQDTLITQLNSLARMSCSVITNSELLNEPDGLTSYKKKIISNSQNHKEFSNYYSIEAVEILYAHVREKNRLIKFIQ